MNRRRSSSLLPSLLIYRDPCPTLKESVLQDRDHAVKSQRLPLSEAPLQDQNGLKSNSLFGLRKFRSDSTHSDSCLSMGRHTTSDDLKENQRVNTPSTFFRHLFDKLKLGHRVKQRRLPVKQEESGTNRTPSPFSDRQGVHRLNEEKGVASPERVQDVDLDFRNNHLYCVDYVHDIFQHVLDIEKRRKPSSIYMSKQREITCEMRAILIDWLIEFAQDLKFAPETLFLTVNYLDRFLSRKNVPKHRLQLVGVTALFLASKYEEIYPCKLEELVELCDGRFPVEDILAMEWCFLDTLKFNLNAATVYIFLTRFLQITFHIYEDDERTPFLAHMLAELSLLEYSLLNYAYSEIAIASVVLALHTLRYSYWNATLAYYSPYSLKDLAPCLEHLYSAFQHLPSHSLSVIRIKYSKPDTYRVALLQPRSYPPPCHSPASHFDSRRPPSSRVTHKNEE